MPRIPPSQQSNLFAYFSLLERSVTEEQQKKIRQVKQTALTQGMSGTYNKENLNILESVRGGRLVAGVIQKNRYADLFESLMDYAEVSSTEKPEELQTNLKELFEKGGRSNASSNAERLAEKLLRTTTAKAYFEQRIVEKIKPFRVPAYKTLVKEEKRKQLEELSREGKLWRLFDTDTKETNIIKEGLSVRKRKDGSTYEQKYFMNLNTGRFGKNPQKVLENIRKQLT
jgi:hypothetical protein